MKEFDAKRKYKIGTLIKDEDPLNRNPSFSPRKPNPVILSGKQLNDMGCRNLQDFLTQNPYNLPKDRTVHAYQVDEGEYEYFDEGMPIQVSTKLDDDGKGGTHFIMNQSKDDIAKFFEKQVASLTKDKKDLEQTLEAERVKLHSKESEWIEKERKFEKTIVTLETKLKAYEELIEGVKEGKALSDGGNSWGQNVMNLLNGPIGNALASVIGNNPKVQEGVGKIITGVGNMMPQGEQPNEQTTQNNTVAQQPQQTQELNKPVETI